MPYHTATVQTAYTYLKPRSLRNANIRIGKKEDYSLWFLTNGTGVVEIEGRAITPEINDCFLLTPGLERRMLPDKNNPFVPLVVQFKTHNNAPLSFVHKKIENELFFRELLNRILSAHQHKNPDAANDWLHVALLEFFDETPAAIDVAHGEMLEYRSEITHLCHRIKSAPEKRWNIEKLARDMFISKTHFYRIFKTLYHCSPQQFITKEKMKKAERLLTYSAYQISEIAGNLGYNHPTQFHRDFKKHHGITASEYRRGSGSAY